jgi:hypothetical protein
MTVYNNLAATNRIVKSIVNQQQDSTKFQRNVGKVVVYLKTFEYESIDESPAYEVGNLSSHAKNVTIKVNIFTVSLDDSSWSRSPRTERCVMPQCEDQPRKSINTACTVFYVLLLRAYSCMHLFQNLLVSLHKCRSLTLGSDEGNKKTQVVSVATITA